MPAPATLLVVEDDPAVTRALSRLLRDQGVAFRAVDSLAGALDADTRNATAIIDLELPDGSGLALFEQLHASGAVAAVVFFSATVDAQQIAQARRLGVFVPKQAGATAAVKAALLLRPSESSELGQRPRYQSTLTTNVAITKTK